MDQMERSELLDPLSEILALAEEEKKRRGLFYISREIAQQPETWERLARFASIAPRGHLPIPRIVLHWRQLGSATQGDSGRSWHLGLRG